MDDSETIENILGVVDILKTVYTAYNVYKSACETYSNARGPARPVKKTRDEFYDTCMARLKEFDDESFRKAVKISPQSHALLQTTLLDRLYRTSKRRPVSPEIRLAVTLMYLANGYSFKFLACSFKLGESTIRKVIYETCQSIWDELHPDFLASQKLSDWDDSSRQLYERSDMPNCLGAIDGKVINIICPKSSVFMYKQHKTKKRYSVVLLAACNADYIFTTAEIGSLRGENDGDIFTRSEFGRQMLNDTLSVPPPTNLPNSYYVFPHYFVADSTFPLLTNLMKPYPGRNLSVAKSKFNASLSKARECTETSFGILSNRWRVLRRTISAAPKNVDKIVLATVVLHNFLIVNKDTTYFDGSDAEIEESIVDNLLSVRFPVSDRSSQRAIELRDILKDFLNMSP